MIYNAEGDILKPVILHDGQATPFIQAHYAKGFSFFQTPDGMLNRSGLCVAYDVIYKWVLPQSILAKHVIYK